LNQKTRFLTVPLSVTSETVENLFKTLGSEGEDESGSRMIFLEIQIGVMRVLLHHPAASLYTLLQVRHIQSVTAQHA